jgi:hypothetical protein
MPCETSPGFAMGSTPRFFGLHHAQIATGNRNTLCKEAIIRTEPIRQIMSFVHKNFYRPNPNGLPDKKNQNSRDGDCKFFLDWKFRLASQSATMEHQPLIL